MLILAARGRARAARGSGGACSPGRRRRPRPRCSASTWRSASPTALWCSPGRPAAQLASLAFGSLCSNSRSENDDDARKLALARGRPGCAPRRPVRRCASRARPPSRGAMVARGTLHGAPPGGSPLERRRRGCCMPRCGSFAISAIADKSSYLRLQWRTPGVRHHGLDSVRCCGHWLPSWSRRGGALAGRSQAGNVPSPRRVAGGAGDLRGGEERSARGERAGRRHARDSLTLAAPVRAQRTEGERSELRGAPRARAP